jgi:hypothetical protein
MMLFPSWIGLSLLCRQIFQLQENVTLKVPFGRWFDALETESFGAKAGLLNTLGKRAKNPKRWEVSLSAFLVNTVSCFFAQNLLPPRNGLETSPNS